MNQNTVTTILKNHFSVELVAKKWAPKSSNSSVWRKLSLNDATAVLEDQRLMFEHQPSVNAPH